MKVLFSDSALSPDLLAVAVGTDVAEGLKDLDRAFDGHLTQYAKHRAFEGKAGTTLAVPTFARVEAKELVLLGVGDRSAGSLGQAARALGALARTRGSKSAELRLSVTNAEQVGIVVEGVAAGNYAYDRHKPEDAKKAALEVVRFDVEGSEPLQGAAKWAEVRSKHQSYARELVNAPAEEVYPESLADAARTLGRLDGVTVEVWDEARLAAEQCVGILAVGRASSRQPRMIHARYRPKGARAHVALVGKGVTFDSGGLSLKPSAGMQTMRCDMAGGATVLAATAAAAELSLPVAIDTWVGAAENLVAGNSYKLGDVLAYKNGVTVEIHNTDAEGRLILADCLIRASEADGVTHVVDLATLTGACMVALGPELTGVFANDDALAAALLGASDRAGEGAWRLPLRQSYKSQLKADWGKIKNVGAREGGAITAALFLEHFVKAGTKWAHLDIAGSAWYDKATDGYAPGATGQGVRTLVNWLEGLSGRG